MSKIKKFQKKNILNFSSSQKFDSEFLSSNNKNYLISYIKNSKNKKINNQTSKTQKSINKPNNYDSKIIQAKTFELESNKKENIKEEKEMQKSTSKIDYRYYKKYPIKEILPINEFRNYNNKLYWLVTYDKLIKSKNIIKILNYSNLIGNNESNNKPIYTEESLKIKTMKIPKFELFFVKGYDKPFVKPNKNSFILAKLYLLTEKEINKILNFINRTDKKVDFDKYISITKKNIYQFIDIKSNPDIDPDINYPYCYIYYLGKFMNISMFLFTNSFNYLKTYNINNNLIYSLPSSKKLYKLIKILIKSFPEYNVDFIINSVINSDLYSNHREKKFEIFKYLSLLEHSVPNKYLLNKILRETIIGIQTNSSISNSSLPFDSGEQIKTSENKLKNQQISSDDIKKSLPAGYKFDYKGSFNSMNNFLLNGGHGTNYLSTCHTMLPSNSIRTYSNKNSIANIPLITIPYDLNINRQSYGNNYFVNYKIFNRNSLMPKKNIEPKKKSSKIIEKVINNENKVNIDINNILNRKKEKKNYSINPGAKENININDGIFRRKKLEKKKNIKNDNKNEYHTPKKRKKIKYYK